MEKEIILYVGFIGSGKTYKSDKLVESGNYTKYSFANELRDCTWDLLDWKPESENDYIEFKKSNIITFKDKSISGRVFLQRLATQVIRKRIPNFFCECMIKTLDNHFKTSDKNVVIDDTRLTNEYTYIINYAIKNSIKLKIIFCDYKSDIYLDAMANKEILTHESEIISQDLIDAGCVDGKTILKFNRFYQINDFVLNKYIGRLN